MSRKLSNVKSVKRIVCKTSRLYASFSCFYLISATRAFLPSPYVKARFGARYSFNKCGFTPVNEEPFGTKRAQTSNMHLFYLHIINSCSIYSLNEMKINENFFAVIYGHHAPCQQSCSGSLALFCMKNFFISVFSFSFFNRTGTQLQLRWQNKNLIKYKLYAIEIP